ncbi:soluble scavenger receptor cysteine-rich domain-containing protein SSC5D-like [Penaeus monodon]|uniref:soluble scavenger receptor cysteine-rich domain-containing protein SSC5D-like n=1 Tax=Penaeus monodon TaxID=6687 RepID=UPI0018A7422C|nr:soluble scavenger receptor cysteine-rich domain-containing protein SSC5D-like [Penaeus monodon]
MRLSILVLLVVAAVAVSGQSQREEARARLRALAQRARAGDQEAQDRLQSLRRKRPLRRNQAVQSESIPRRPVFQGASLAPVVEVTEAPAPVPAPAPQRVRVPVRRTRVRLPRPTKATTPPPPPSTFPPFSPVQLFTETTEDSFLATDPVTEAPVFETFPTEAVTEAPVFQNVIEPSPVPFRPRVRQRQQFQSTDLDFEPHRALNTGLEIDTRSENIIQHSRIDGTTKPTVETIRRYSYFDEQGNYIFGYEAADGSFKEEKRRLDCIVEGKYGYVDPDGIRREFTYTSGNQCDPNATPSPDGEEVVLPLNDQFLTQTQERRLSDSELTELNFNRRRRPVVHRRLRPVSRPQVIRTQQVAVEEPVTQAPAPQFTTPASFNRFTTPSSFRRPTTTLQETRPTTPEFVETPAPTTVFRPVTSAPRQPVVTSSAFRPTPKPVSFDFDREFSNLFSNFPGPRQTTRTQLFTQPKPTTPFTPRPTPAPTTRPPPPPPPPTTRVPATFPPATFPPATFPPATFPPVRTSPATSRPSLDDGSRTLGGGDLAPQLVFDAATGTFKTVRVNTKARPTPPRPAVQTSFAPAPTFAPVTSVPAGRPLPGLSTGGSPLPSVPTGPLFINNPGRSPAASEFDKFFSQFNIKF